MRTEVSDSRRLRVRQSQAIFLILAALLLLCTTLYATPEQCYPAGTPPTCVSSIHLPTGKCISYGYTIDDPISSDPFMIAGATDQGFGVSHCNRFVGVSMFINYVAIQAQRPSPAGTTAILRVYLGDDLSFGDLRPGFLVDTAIVSLPSSIGSTDYQVVPLDTTIDTQGSTFWVELYFPIANGVSMGTRGKNTPGLLGESFVVSHEASNATETWEDYENVTPGTAYNDRAPVLRPLYLVDCQRTCFINLFSLDFQTSEDGDSIEVECGITEQPTDSVFIDLLTTDPSEGLPSTTQLIFTPANWNLPQYFWVVGQDDAITDGDIMYHIQAFASSVDSCYDGEATQYSIENLDNDFVFLETVPVGDPGNPANSDGYGAVGYSYEIGKYEVTNEQYAAFLNAIGQSDNIGLYNGSMATDDRGGITRSGSFGSYTYSTRANMANKPVNFVDLHDCMRFCNWLHNGRPSGSIDPTTTEDGAYNMSVSIGGIINRKADAAWAVPTYDELFKAAFYDPVNVGADATGDPDYWDMPTMSNGNPPTKATANSVGDISNPGPNVINYDDGAVWNGVIGNFTTVGSAGSQSDSYYGAYDLGGNITEWDEGQFNSGGFTFSGLNGANCTYATAPSISNFGNGSGTVDSESPFVGFRVVKFTNCVCGDANGDGAVSITDAVHIINFIFGGGPPPLCNSDVDPSGNVSITDAVYIINYIFGGGPAPNCP